MRNYLTSYDPFFSVFFPTTELEDDSDMMKSNIVECEDHYKIMIMMPGVQKKDISLSLRNNVLTVKASYRQQVGNYLHLESRSGTYSRNFRVPQNTLDRDISASLDDGILTIRINKFHKSKSKEDKD